METQQPENQTPSEKKQANFYLKYSGLAFQMIGTLVVLAFIGQWLDQYFNINRPYITTVCCLFGVFASMYILIKDLTSTK